MVCRQIPMNKISYQCGILSGSLSFIINIMSQNHPPVTLNHFSLSFFLLSIKSQFDIFSQFGTTTTQESTLSICYNKLVMNQNLGQHNSSKSNANALWVKLCWKVVIGGFTKMIPSGPIFLNLNYFRHNIWRLSSVQFHFWYIFGTSWSQLTAEEGFTMESVSIQTGCRKDVNEILRTSWM